MEQISLRRPDWCLQKKFGFKRRVFFGGGGAHKARGNAQPLGDSKWPFHPPVEGHKKPFKGSQNHHLITPSKGHDLRIAIRGGFFGFRSLKFLSLEGPVHPTHPPKNITKWKNHQGKPQLGKIPVRETWRIPVRETWKIPVREISPYFARRDLHTKTPYDIHQLQFTLWTWVVQNMGTVDMWQK